MKENKNLRVNRKNRNCLFNREAAMRIQGFRGNCDSQASWGCAPALPNRIREVSLRVIHAVFHMKHDTNKKAFSCWLQATSRRQRKSFSVQQFYKNAAEVWASSPHLRSKLNFAICFLCCNCIFWSCPIQAKLNHENQGCKFEQGNGAIAACW